MSRIKGLIDVRALCYLTLCTELCTVISMRYTLPITKVRENLPTLVDNAYKKLHDYVITVNGTPTAILMSIDEYESLQETLDILGDKKLMKSIKQGEKELAEGKGIPWEQAKKELGWD